MVAGCATEGERIVSGLFVRYPGVMSCYSLWLISWCERHPRGSFFLSLVQSNMGYFLPLNLHLIWDYWVWSSIDLKTNNNHLKSYARQTGRRPHPSSFSCHPSSATRQPLIGCVSCHAHCKTAVERESLSLNATWCTSVLLDRWLFHWLRRRRQLKCWPRWHKYNVQRNGQRGRRKTKAKERKLITVVTRPRPILTNPKLLFSQFSYFYIGELT